ncbi:MAG: hypothetical protein ACP5IO_00820, partial [Elusimicrobiales bacterium]
VSGTTGSGDLVFSTQPSFTTGITVSGWGNFSGGITASSGTFTTAVGTPRMNLTSNVYISSTTSANYGGVYVSTHIYLVSGARYYGNGSQITNIDASKITTGTLPPSRGGTGISGAGGTANRVLITTDGSSWTAGQINPATMISAGALPINVIASSIAVNAVYTGAISDGAVTDAKVSDNISINNGNLYSISGSGNVGIGTTNPQYKLDVYGDLRVTGIIRDFCIPVAYPNGTCPSTHPRMSGFFPNDSGYIDFYAMDAASSWTRYRFSLFSGGTIICCKIWY